MHVHTLCIQVGSMSDTPLPPGATISTVIPSDAGTHRPQSHNMYNRTKETNTNKVEATVSATAFTCIAVDGCTFGSMALLNNPLQNS